MECLVHKEVQFNCSVQLAHIVQRQQLKYSVMLEIIVLEGLLLKYCA